MAATPEPSAPRITRLRAAGVIAAGLALAGPLLGVLWAWIAPSVHGVVALTRSGERVQAYLGSEAENLFVAPVLLLALLGAVAVVTATLAWQWRAHRGPGMIAGLSVGLIAAAGAAVLVGHRLVLRRYGVIDVDSAPVTPEHRIYYVTEGPPVFLGHTPLQIAATLLLPAATAALVYGLCATWCGRDDLGGYPPEPERRGQRAVTAEAGVPPRR